MKRRKKNVDSNDINCQSAYGKTALHILAEKGLTEACRVLLANDKIDVNCEDDYNTTPLFRACMSGSIELVALILNQPGVAINHVDCHVQTALECVAYSKNGELCKLLLSRGAAVTRSIHYPNIFLTIDVILKSWKTYLPRWSRFNTCKYYPDEFNKDIALQWLLCCHRLKVFPKDICYLIMEYHAEVWKQIKTGELRYIQ